MAFSLNVHNNTITNLESHFEKCQKYFGPLESFSPNKPVTVAHKVLRHAVKIEESVKKVVTGDDQWYEIGLADPDAMKRRKSFMLAKPNIFETAKKACNLQVELAGRGTEILNGDIRRAKMREREKLAPIMLILEQKSAEYEFESLMLQPETTEELELKMAYYAWKELVERLEIVIEQQNDPQYKRQAERMHLEAVRMQTVNMADYCLYYYGPLER